MALKRNNPGCDCCGDECGYCQSGTTPATVTVTFPDMSFSTCDMSNLSFQSFELSPVAGFNCWWDFEDAAMDFGICTDGITIDARVERSGTTNYLEVSVLGPFGMKRWNNLATRDDSLIDCSVAVDLPSEDASFDDVTWTPN